jgi:glucokinase
LLPLKLLEMWGNKLDAEAVASLARQGESGALEAFLVMGRRLGIALASVANILDLEAIIIGGGVAASYDLFQPALSVELGRRCFPQIAADLVIVKGELGDDAGLLGGGALAATL